MREAATTEHHHLPLFPSFPCLSDLIISKCPMLSLMPVVAQGSETAHSSSSPFSDLSKLKFLSLYGLEQLESLPEEWLPKTSLLLRPCRQSDLLKALNFPVLCPILHCNGIPVSNILFFSFFFLNVSDVSI
jgi:hypothetical protein